MTNDSSRAEMRKTLNHNEPHDGRRPTWASVNLDVLAANFHSIQQRVASNVKIMSMVKADAYGHGAVQCARRLAVEGTDWFGVALPEEGLQLREGGIQQPILCAGGFWHGQASLCLNQRLTPVVYRLDMIESLDQAARDCGTIAAMHVKVDTGMGRLGIRWDQLNEFVAGLERFRNVKVEGVQTHFAAADDAACEPLTRDQIDRFTQAISIFRDHGHRPVHLHLANSAAIYGNRESWGNMVRPGGALYGLWRDVLPLSVREPHLNAVMSLHSQISLLKWVPPGETIGYGCTFEASRKSLIATVPIGYHDGYMRGFSNRANVIVRGTYAPVVGRISMDLTLIDVTDVTGVEVGDVVTLLGSSADSGLNISAEDLARVAGTLSYEVTCGIGQRVPRVYSGLP
jgi:alanine racemase